MSSKDGEMVLIPAEWKIFGFRGVAKKLIPVAAKA